MAIVRALFPAAYRLEHLDVESVVVCTNKATYVPYRGPWEIETWVRERLLDTVARELGLEPAVVRERNLLRPDELPRESTTGVELQGFDPRRTFDDALALVDVPAFRARQAAARAEGRLLGLGLVNVVEPAPVTPSLIRAMGIMAAPRTVQEARARLELDGSVTVFTSQMPHGQSHETTLAQLAADELGLTLDRVRVVHGDTQLTPFNMVGTGGSRAATLASGAVVGRGVGGARAGAGRGLRADGDRAGRPRAGRRARWWPGARPRCGGRSPRSGASPPCGRAWPTPTGARASRRSAPTSPRRAPGRWPPTPARSRSTPRPGWCTSTATSWSATAAR